MLDVCTGSLRIKTLVCSDAFNAAPHSVNTCEVLTDF